MNYFAHGRPFLDDPYFIAGAATPDWLRMLDRRVRARSKAANHWIHHADPAMASLARGVMQHHHDDGWFHQTRAFGELCLQFTIELRDLLPPDDSLRTSFLGHILVELLLDAALIADDPPRLDEYYAAIDQLDPTRVADGIECITGQSMEKLARLIPKFSAERFLYDYLDDAKLLRRINQVMRRVKLPAVSDQLLEWLPGARVIIENRAADLLAPPRSSVPDT